MSEVVGECFPLIDTLVQSMRAEPDALRLSMLSGILCRSYRFGDQIGFHNFESADHIRLDAQANVAIHILSRLNGEPYEFRLGGGPPAISPIPITPEFAHAGTWMKGWTLAVISRQADLADKLLALRTDIFNQRPIHTPEVTLRWVDLYAAILTGADVTRHPAFLWLRDYVATCPPKGSHGKAVKFLSGPFLDLLKPFSEYDSAGFAVALEKALAQHKKYWSATEKRRKDPEGFIAMNLTALAALAHDRGISAEVESDYLPRPWVTGEMFRTSPVAGSL